MCVSKKLTLITAHCASKNPTRLSVQEFKNFKTWISSVVFSSKEKEEWCKIKWNKRSLKKLGLFHDYWNDYNKLVTKNKQQKQYVLQIVSNFRRKPTDYKKSLYLSVKISSKNKWFLHFSLEQLVIRDEIVDRYIYAF